MLQGFGGSLKSLQNAHVAIKKVDRTVSQSLTTVTTNSEVMHLLKVMRVDLHLALSESQRRALLKHDAIRATSVSGLPISST